MVKQTSSFGRNLPTSARQLSPDVNLLPHFIDCCRNFVLLLLGRKPFALIKDHVLLDLVRFLFLCLASFGNRREEVGAATLLAYFLSWLA